jgi:hypothetical protein
MKLSDILCNGHKQAITASAPTEMINNLKLAIAADALAQMANAGNEFAADALAEIYEQTISKAQAANDEILKRKPGFFDK